MRALMLLLAAFLLASPARAATPAEFSGAFVGIDDAEGTALWLETRGALVNGRFLTKSGRTVYLTGEPIEGGIEGALMSPEGGAYFRMETRSLGLMLILIPVDAAGQPAPKEALVRHFVREGVRMPARPHVLTPPLAFGSRRVDPLKFLENYPFWSPDDTSFAYDIMTDRYRAMIGLYPYLMTDILWKLCQSQKPSRYLAAALTGQGVDCNGLRGRLDNVSDVASFNAFKDKVDDERWTALQVLGCSRGMTPPKYCEDFGKRTAEAAGQNRNAAMILNEIR